MIRGYNSTIIVKEKPCVRCGKKSVIFSKGRCAFCAKIEDTTKRMDKIVEKELEQDSLSDLVKDADALISTYVRLKYSDEYGNCQCYTCPTILPYTQLQAGHYIGRSHMLLRFDISRNLRPQCVICNSHKRGNLAVYSQNLENEHPGLPDILLEEATIVYKISRTELTNIIAEYSVKVRELKKKIIMDR